GFGFTPIVVVTDSDAEELVSIVPYKVMKDPDGFVSAQKALAKYRGIEYEAPGANYSPETWKDNRGRSFQATYLTSTEAAITLRLENGKLATLLITKLSEDSQKRLAEIQASE
ncbi:MAG: hypothetical protein AAF226_06165, partial [Verrucomicrobiota bacterium]